MFDFLNFDWAERLPWGGIGGFIKANLPPLVILLINQIILFLIDLSALVERHETHSLYQLSVYAKSVIYLNLNMLIIPGLTLTTSTPLITIIFQKQFRLTELLGDFYIANSGIFFVSILIQQACLSSAFYLLNLADVFFAYFSPWLALEKRKIFTDSAPWRRKEQFCF
jgi:Calcium-dependent channel, 7TM region, putative phosphate